MATHMDGSLDGSRIRIPSNLFGYLAVKLDGEKAPSGLAFNELKLVGLGLIVGVQ